MKKHLITVAGIGFVALLAIGVVFASPFPRFIDAAARDYSAFIDSMTNSDDVHQLGRNLERLQSLESHE